MDPHSILDHGDTPEMRAPEKPREWQGTHANAPAATGEVRFPGEDGGKSLAGMAQKDLTATLQLLAEQARYITGATGAAIALRDEGEMVCRASAGHSAPEVGSLLQVNSGLSGESVRTRQTLRCDDAATDARVNRESCEALGIASVVVMPLVQGDDVIGVFELFSDKPHVFEGRDITALERMGSMVFTALEHAMAVHGVTIWPGPENGGPAGAARPAGELPVVGEVPDVSSENKGSVAGVASPPDGAKVGGSLAQAENEQAGGAVEASADPKIPDTVSGIAFHGQVPSPGGSGLTPAVSPISAAAWQAESDDILGEIEQAGESAATGDNLTSVPGPSATHAVGGETGEDSILESEPDSPVPTLGEHAKVEDAAGGEVTNSSIPIRSAVANLKKCEACGFPISEGRHLCLDCEKKQVQSGNAALSLTGAAAHVSQAGIGSAQVVPSSEMAPDDGPRFLNDEQEETSWLASHRYMVMAIAIAVVIVVALLLAH
jgi:putative methionine-R-sulfoxide reductase with GAF domain